MWQTYTTLITELAVSNTKNVKTTWDFKTVFQLICNIFLMRQIYKPFKWKWLSKCWHLLVPALLKVRCDSVLWLRHLLSSFDEGGAQRRLWREVCVCMLAQTELTEPGCVCRGKVSPTVPQAEASQPEKLAQQKWKSREEPQIDMLVKQCGIPQSPWFPVRPPLIGGGAYLQVCNSRAGLPVTESRLILCFIKLQNYVLIPCLVIN